MKESTKKKIVENCGLNVGCQVTEDPIRKLPFVTAIGFRIKNCNVALSVLVEMFEQLRKQHKMNEEFDLKLDLKRIK